MNSPRPMQNSELNNNKVLCYCYLLKQHVMELGKEKEKLEDIAHDQKDIETSGFPVIDATAKNTENTLQDDGTMTRRVEKGPVIKSAKFSKEHIQSIKRLQDINNRNKLSAKRKEEDDKEIR